jgi:hypothetical protein
MSRLVFTLVSALAWTPSATPRSRTCQIDPDALLRAVPSLENIPEQPEQRSRQEHCNGQRKHPG